ncbi:MAG TPA: LysE family translocator [Sphingomicrobium sp.]|nr:LysE family translocator [Sphingomicrobium sp.]
MYGLGRRSFCWARCLLAASRIGYTLLKWVGAAYLIWVGIKLLIQPRERFDSMSGGAGDLPPLAFLKQGLLTNVLNPKAGVFYLTFLPQFIPVGTNVAIFSLLLASIHVLLGLAWFAVLISATVPMRDLLRRPRFVRGMDRVAGVVFVGFGARLALTR